MKCSARGHRSVMCALGTQASEISVRDRWLLPVLADRFGFETAELIERDAKRSLWEAVIERGVLSDDELVALTAQRFHLGVADVRRVSAQALELVPERWARQFGVLPLAIDRDMLVVATSNPCDVDAERALAFAAGRAVRFAMASPDAIATRIDAVYGSAEPDPGA